jgi:hypothetical protein
MSGLNQAGDLFPFSEVVPESAQFGVPERASILTQRRRVRITPQTGPTATPGSQVSFLVADQGGLIDMRSIVLNYNLIVTGGTAAACGDDGHVFTTFQALLNGQLLENINNAPKLMNAEITLAGSKSYYQTAGSFQGLELLNEDLQNVLPTGSSVNGAYGFVVGNQPLIATRCSRAVAAPFGVTAGEQRSIPLGLICGLGRMRTYLPIALTGELAIVGICGSNNDVLFSTGSATDSTYTLGAISLEYDVVVPDARYMSVLQKVAMDDGQGLVIPYESAIVSTGATIPVSASALSESTLIVSRATNNLTRVAVVQLPAGFSGMGFPSQSCFSHAGVVSFQARVGSQNYPQIAATGDASLFNMSMLAYGSVMQENGTITNRSLWGNSTSAATPGTTAVFETAEASSGGVVKYAYGDRCVLAYGFQTIKGAAVSSLIDGISLSGASGSQLIVTLVSAPQTSYTPFVILTALKFVKAQGGAVQVIGA